MRLATTLLLPILLAAALVTLTPLAFATPGDPLWMPGIYDDADQDDVVGIAVDDALAVELPRAVDGFVSTTQRIDTLRRPLTSDNLRFDTLRLRSPPTL
jgi:hypothetical protein